jgi:hypothetical protein
MRTEPNGLSALPPPYRGWVAISNDPDGTTMREWDALHELLWQRLALPIADSFFLFNYSERYPDQVCIEHDPEILAAHPHDTMHTWGDFCDTRSRLFTRDDAARGLEMLRRHGARPLVWTDHANFAGNLLHNAVVPAQPVLEDHSGRPCENFAYSLDLIEAAGVRYVWNGRLTRRVGQDRPLGRREWYAHEASPARHPRLWAAADLLAAPFWRRVRAQAFDYDADANRQYFARRFPDGRSLHCFRRFGEWRYANIDGLARSLDAERLDRLAQVEGTMIVYTHLGKRAAGRGAQSQHVPPPTVAALQGLAARLREGQLLVSSVSRLLDYLVLRDSAVCDAAGVVDFKADGVRFKSLSPADLSGFEFGLAPAQADRAGDVRCEGVPLEVVTERFDDGACRVRIA